MLKKLRSKLFISIAIAALIGVAFSFYADFSQLKAAFSAFNYEFIPLAAACASVNYLFRFARWEYYLRVLEIKVPRSQSFGIFISSLSMSVTPGKMGELVKSYFLKSLRAVPISKSAPIVFAERITDFLDLLIISIIGAYSIGYEKRLIIVVALIFVAGIGIIASRSFSMKIIRKAEKISFIAKRIKPIESAYESSHAMLSGKALIISSLIGLAGWFIECLGFLFVLDGLDIHLKILSASFIYAFSTVVGAVSFLPGGLGATETSLAGLLVLAKIPKNSAVAATFIIRAATLWFAVIIGVGMLSYMLKHYGAALNEKLENNSYASAVKDGRANVQ
ncbi:MAG TPA: lysylphosphatidylglycerol synthase transmembrane domain-containing protein [Candidatus Acidoferrales bacterium]|nr:lysylphosphatidylglycerol synthase transmembrane domain-containing protein [Candidatus Acidoferrales bacterium]